MSRRWIALFLAMVLIIVAMMPSMADGFATDEVLEASTVTAPAAASAVEEESIEAPTSEPTEAPASEETETPAPEMTEDSDTEPTEEPTPVPEALQAAMTAQQRSVFANEQAIDVLLVVQGGAEECAVEWQVLMDGKTVQTNSCSIGAERTAKYSYLPGSFGTCTVRAVVTDAAGQMAETSIQVPVAVREYEDSSIWAASVSGAGRTGDWRRDLVAVARTQIGYEESTRNFILDEDGNRQGYTRYGDWYGSNYTEWCGMFVSFCLRYAGIGSDSFPRAASCSRWKELLLHLDAYEDDENAYQPQPGDLVFFNWEGGNTPRHVGIVEKVEGGRVYTIEGNSAKQVRRRDYSLGSGDIVGYANTTALMRRAGVLDEPTPPPVDEPVPTDADEPIPTPSSMVEDDAETKENGRNEPGEANPEGETETTASDLTPSDDGATETTASDLVLFDEGQALIGDAGEEERIDGDAAMKIGFATPNDLRAAAVIGDLKQYVVDKGGTFSLQLLKDNQIIEDGEQVVIGETYSLTLGISLPKGFQPGTYTYQLPAGITITPQSDIPITSSDNVTFGHWSVDEDGLVTFVFEENANDQQNVSISNAISIQFQEGQEKIDFEGTTVMVVTKEDPPPEQPTASLDKSGKLGSDGEHIDWTISVQGNDGYPLAGMTITDSIVGGNHTYDQENWQADVEFYVLDAADTYYSYSISGSNVEWTEDASGWSYTIPSTFICTGCKDPDHIGADGKHTEHTVTVKNSWKCYFYFDSYFEGDASGVYQNKVVAGDKEDTANVIVTTGAKGVIRKEGQLKDGVFQWTIDATIPGSTETSYYWNLWDETRIYDAQGTSGAYVMNDLADGATVTATYTDASGSEVTVQVPKVKDATENDPFAWSSWIEPQSDGINYGNEISFLHRCTCTEGHCAVWGNGTCDKKSSSNPAFCRCWNETQAVTFHITYETKASTDILETYGGMDYRFRNSVAIKKKVRDDSGKLINTADDDDSAYVPIPGVFKKERLQGATASDGVYVAKYRITVNEAKEDLSGNKDGVVITDTMSDTLFYRQGSMQLTKTDAAGNVTEMTEGMDYTIQVTNSNHTLEISIPEPGPYMYTLVYEAVIDVTGYHEAILYTNNAEVTLGGITYRATSGDDMLTNYTSSASSYKITIAKTNAGNQPLAGATFGLYAENGNLITDGISDGNGRIIFQTNVTQGIIFSKNTPYYIQEITAPNGYMRDGAKHWFYFADAEDPTLTSKYSDIQRGKSEVSFTVINNCSYEMPSTGGGGTTLYTAGGLLLIAAALLLYSQKKRWKGGNSPS